MTEEKQQLVVEVAQNGLQEGRNEDRDDRQGEEGGIEGGRAGRARVGPTGPVMVVKQDNVGKGEGLGVDDTGGEVNYDDLTEGDVSDEKSSHSVH